MTRSASVLETERLTLRRFRRTDAAFILALLNDPAWIRYIGDKGVRTLADAARYIENGPRAMYRQHGFGLYLVQLAHPREPIGMCGLIRRDGLDDVDLGFAFLPRFRGQGYAFEAASAIAQYAKRELGLSRIVAITSPGNAASARLLRKLGFHTERRIELHGEALDLHAREAS